MFPRLFSLLSPSSVYCIDAKLGFDDNAQFRQAPLFAQRDFSMEDKREVAAAKHGLNYIGLDGNIGCLGAQLAHTAPTLLTLPTLLHCPPHTTRPLSGFLVNGLDAEIQAKMDDKTVMIRLTKVCCRDVETDKETPTSPDTDRSH